MYKVLFLGWEYYPVFTGGLGMVCNAIAEEMANKGIEVYVVLPSVPKKMPVTNVKFPTLNSKQLFTKRKISENVTVNVANIEMNPYQNFEETKASSSTSEFMEVFRSKKKRGQVSDGLYGEDLMHKVYLYTEMIKDLVLDLEFDVIHAHDWMTYFAALEAKNITGKKCVMHVHATELDRTAGNPHELIFNIEKYMLNKSDMVVAISEFTKAKLIDRYSVDPNKIRVVHNALDERHSFEVDWDLDFGKGKKVMFLGRAVVQKGIDTFIEVANRVIQKLPNTIFIFAGDGDQLPRAIEKVCDLGIQDNFIFTGSVDRYHGDVLYKNSDLFLLTSISEPFGITALESIRQGTPVVVSKDSGVSEVLPNALSVDFWDIDRFADYVYNILSDEVLYETLKENQISDYSKLTWKKQVDKLVEIFNTVMETAHG